MHERNRLNSNCKKRNQMRVESLGRREVSVTKVVKRLNVFDYRDAPFYSGLRPKPKRATRPIDPPLLPLLPYTVRVCIGKRGSRILRSAGVTHPAASSSNSSAHFLCSRERACVHLLLTLDFSYFSVWAVFAFGGHCQRIPFQRSN
jgi:hypothetical protein